MGYKLDGKMVIGVSSRALFDLTKENEIYENEGLDAYSKYQIEHEQDLLQPGPGFGLVKSLLKLNEIIPGKDLVEVIIMSRNSADTSLRVFNAIEHYGLNITRSVLAGGTKLAPYLTAFRTDLFLSAYEDDVQYAVDNGIAGAIICTEFGNCAQCDDNQIRIAFDGDAVLFADEYEAIYKEHGLDAFAENEKLHAKEPMKEGPFTNFLKKLSEIQSQLGPGNSYIRTALVTSRSAPAHERVIRTMRAWNVRVDESFFLGGLDKRDVLAAFGAQIFFDDQTIHTESAAKAVPAARVPYKTSGEMDRIQSQRKTK